MSDTTEFLNGIDYNHARSAADLMIFSIKEATIDEVDAKRKAVKIENSASKVDISRYPFTDTSSS